MSSGKYKYKHSHSEKPITFVLNDDGILIIQEGRTDRMIHYSEIEKIHLLPKPQKLRIHNHVCYLKHQNGQTVIKSTNYRSFGYFTDQRKEYIPFIKELVHKTVKKNPATIVYSGNSAKLHLLYFLITTVVVLGSAITLVLFGPVFLPAYFISAILLAYFFYYLTKVVPMTYPQKINNGDIPDRILPTIK